MKTIMSCLALVAMAVFTSAAFAQEPTLTSVEAKFDTTTHNKNANSKLDVYFKTSGGHEVAKCEGNEGEWKRNASHTVTLQVESNPTKGEVANGSVSLTFHPQGADQWKFNYKVTLTFSDGSVIRKEFNGCVLTQHDASRTDSL
jgi:hypothetical protein